MNLQSGYRELVYGYRIKGFGITTYCKVVAVDKDITLFFGKKLKSFCVSISYDHTKPTELYLDRVESDKDCMVGGRLSDLQKGAVRFVKLALYTVKRWFPHVTVIRLLDDSNITCKTKSIPLRLPLNYIAKYDKTWYEYHFHATIDTDKLNINTENYYHSLEVLTQPHKEEFDKIAKRVSAIIPFETQYRASTTPREFLERVRAYLGESYCEKGSKLLNAFMGYLQITHVPYWKILMKDVNTVPDFEREEITREDAIRMLHGGNRTRRARTRTGAARYQFIF